MDPIPIDPAAVSECDAVLVTHEHLDHMHPPSVPATGRRGGDAVRVGGCYEDADCDVNREKLDGRDRVVAPGDRLSVGDLTVHVRAGDDPDAIGEVTYVIEHDAGSFFRGGDDRVADSFGRIGDEFDLDVGALAMGSVGRQ